MDNMDNIFTDKAQVENLRKSFEKLGIENAVDELSKPKLEFRAKSSCRSCWGTGKVMIEEETPQESTMSMASNLSQYTTQMVKSNKQLVEKMCGCVKVKRRK